MRGVTKSISQIAIRCIGLGGALILPTLARAQEAESILQNGTDYLIGILGPGVFLLGVIIAGFSLAMGNRDGVIKGIYAIVGGVCILGANAIVETIKSFMN